MIDNTENINTPNTADSASNGQLMQVQAGAITLAGLLHIPPDAHGMVILTHGIEGIVDGTHKASLILARSLYQSGLATLLLDLFTAEEQQVDHETGYFRLNTEIMQQRIIGTADWLLGRPDTRHLSLGYFGASVSGAAALIAAAERPDLVAAIVAAGTTIDIVQDRLRRIMSPTMLIVAQQDSAMVQQNQQALDDLTFEKQFEQIPGGAMLFETEEMINEVARLAGGWFTKHLTLIGYQ